MEYLILVPIITYVLWNIYAIIEGWREGKYWFLRKEKVSDDVDKMMGKNDHAIWTIQRAILALVIVSLNGILLYYSGGLFWLKWLLTTLALTLSFSFFHDGEYYCERNNLNPKVYPKRWKDSSTTSTAKIELNYTVRLICFIISIISILMIVLL